MAKHVYPSGPEDARLLFVGEAPGKSEEVAGYPFAGVTGRLVRAALRSANVDPEKDVRFANVMTKAPRHIPMDIGGRKRLVAEHWDVLEGELARSKASVVVACGWLAMFRLTGYAGNIQDETGGVRPASEFPKWTTVLERGDLVHGLPKDSLVVTTMHPAAAMHRTKTWIDWLVIERAIRRAGFYASGWLKWKQKLPGFKQASAEEVDGSLERAGYVVIDTEFDRDTKVPFLIGLTTDRVDGVLSFKPTADHCLVLKKHLMRGDLLKVAHFHEADVESLRAAGVDVKPPWFDTLQAFNVVWPGVKVGLENVAQFLLDDVWNWKRMSHEDPAYNALDVDVTERCFKIIRRELSRSGLAEVYEQEVQCNAPLAMAMTGRGLQVDGERQEQALARNTVEQADVLARVRAQVERYSLRRAEPLMLVKSRWKATERQAEALMRMTANQPDVKCLVHDDYWGQRKKRFSMNELCRCARVHEETADGREKWTEAKREAKKIEDKLVKLRTDGLNLGSPQQMQWLLYDKDGLGLPTQYLHGKVTTNADAVASLLAMKKVQKLDGGKVVELLRGIKAWQHLRKMRNTFLKPPVDGEGVAHPPYRLHGTETGRPASGEETAVADKATNEWAFNALNIPEECRGIYVPRVT